MPADLEVSGRGVIAGTIQLPRVGLWTADLVVDHAEDITGAVTLTSGDGQLSLRGTVKRGGTYQEVGHLRVVGGAGGLDADAPPVYYRSVALGLPLRALLAAVGETLSATTDAAVLNVFLERWVRDRGPGGTALAALADAANATWRVLDDGTVWLGTDTYPVSDVDHELFDSVPSERRVAFATEHVPAAVRPGTTFLGERVAFVQWTVAPSAITTQVWYERERARANANPLLGAIQAIARNTMRETRFHALYPARVQSQAPDGTLAVIPDHQDFPPMVGVPLRTIAPGVRVEVDPGARVQIGFEGGDPARPVARLFETDAAGLYPVAHENSAVQEHYHDLGGGTAYAGPFAVTGLSKAVGAVTLPVQPAAASAVKIAAGTGHQKVRFPA